MLHNIKELPVYAQPSNIMPTEECVTVLLSNLQESAICSRVPFAVDTNAAFVVDLNELNSPGDITCDDMGVWKWGGSRKKWMLVDENGFVLSLDDKVQDPNCYLVWRRYYTLKVSPDVKRLIIVLQGQLIVVNVVPGICSVLKLWFFRDDIFMI